MEVEDLAHIDHQVGLDDAILSSSKPLLVPGPHKLAKTYLSTAAPEARHVAPLGQLAWVPDRGSWQDTRPV